MKAEVEAEDASAAASNARIHRGSYRRTTVATDPGLRLAGGVLGGAKTAISWISVAGRLIFMAPW